MVSGDRQLRIWDPAGGGYAAEPDEQLLPEGSVRAYLQPTAGHSVPRTPGLPSSQLTPSTSVLPGPSTAALSPGVPRMQMPPTPSLATAVPLQAPPTSVSFAIAPMQPPSSLAVARSHQPRSPTPETVTKMPSLKPPLAAGAAGAPGTGAPRPSPAAPGGQSGAVLTPMQRAPRLPDEATRALRAPRNVIFPPTVRAVRLQGLGFVQPASCLQDYPLARLELVATDPRDVGWHKRVLSELAAVL